MKFIAYLIAALWLSAAWCPAVVVINSFTFSAGGSPPPPGGDTYYSQVVLLLNGDGADGGTTITDSSPLAQTPTGNTGVVTSTTSPKFGTASLSCSGTAAVAYAAGASWAFGNGDFCVEYWLNTSDSYAQIMGMRVYETAAWNVFLYDSKLYWQRFLADGNLYNVSIASYMGGWHHFAHVRIGTTHKLYIDGVAVSSVTDSYNYNNSSRPFYVGGMSGGNFDFTGRLEVRITKGNGRYTTDFTPPSAAFPTS